MLHEQSSLQRNVFFLPVTLHHLWGQRSWRNPLRGDKLLICSLGALIEYVQSKNCQRMGSIWLQVLLNDIRRRRHGAKSAFFSSAMLQFCWAHYSSGPCSDFTHLCSDLSLLTPEINLFWISQENIVDEQLISSRRALSRACLMYTLRVVSGWNWRRMERKIRFCYFPHKISQEATLFPHRVWTHVSNTHFGFSVIKATSGGRPELAFV